MPIMDLTIANYQLTAGTVFRLLDDYYFVETVMHTQPQAVAYCVPFDIKDKKKIITDISKKFSVNVICQALFDGSAEVIDPHSTRYEAPSPTLQQQLKYDMWVAFIDALLSVTGGKYSRATADVESAKQLINWSIYKHLAPSNSSCQERIKLIDEAGGDKRVLCPGGYHSMKGASRISLASEELILQYVTDEYLVYQSNEKVNVASIYDKFKKEWQSLHTVSPTLYPKLPCLETFHKRIRNVNKILVATCRLNDKQKTKLKKQRKTDYVIDRILERVEIDAIHIGMGIVKFETKNGKRTRIYRGRIVLMVAIDVYSRNIVGYSYHIAKKPGESTDLSVECFKNILMPKGKSNWTAFGKPFSIVTDATTSATGNQFHKIVTSTGTVHIVTPTNEPWLKPFIERFFGTLRSDFLSKFECYLGSKQYKNHDHLNNDDTVDKKALSVKEEDCLTEEQFVEEFEDYITNHYHVSGHSGLNGRSPNDIWNKAVESFSFERTTMPPDHPVFKRFGLKSSERKIHQDGYVRFDNHKYISPKLKELYNEGVKVIKFYYSDIDFSKISFERAGWYSAVLSPSKYTPTDTTQRAELNDCRVNQHNDSPKRERKRFEPSKGANTTKKLKTKKSLITNKSQPQAINTQSTDTQTSIDDAENEMMKHALHLLNVDAKADITPPDASLPKEQTTTTAAIPVKLMELL